MPAQPMPGYFFTPQHIILVGASERANSLGERILTALLGSAYQGKITPVNLRHKTVAGLQAYPNLGKINEAADLVIAVTPPESYETLLRACKKKQFHHIILIQDWQTLSPEERQTAHTAVTRHHGSELNISVCNSAGIQLPAQGLNCGTLPDFPAGYTALLTGETAVSREIETLLRHMRQGISRHISLNYALSLTTAADWLNRFGHNHHTRLAVVHYNPLENPRKLFSAIRHFTRHTPLLLYCSHAADEDEQAVLNALARHCNFLPVFGSGQLEAALHAGLSNIKPVSTPAVLSDTPAAWLAAPARADGLTLYLPSEKNLPQQGYLGSTPTAAFFRDQAAQQLQQPHNDALLTVIAAQTPEDESALTRVLKKLAQQSDKPLLISSRFSDGLLHFNRPEQALHTLALRNFAEQLKQAQLNIAPPKSGRLKPLNPAKIKRLSEAQDWTALADALNLPDYRHQPPHQATQLAFRRHPHFGAYVLARYQGQTAAVLPPFTTLDTAYLAEFIRAGRQKNVIQRFLNSLNILIRQQTDCGEILLNLDGSGFSSDFRPSEKQPAYRQASKAAATRLQSAADFIRSRNAAAAEFLLNTGEAAGLLDKTHTAPAYPESVLAPYPDGYPQSFTLKNGENLSIRPFEPEDAEAKQQFVRSLSPQTRYTRFLSHTNELPTTTLARFSRLDYFSEGAFVAENSDGLILGVSRFSRLSRDECEFGITLAESIRGSGLAVFLMQQIIGLATQQGYQVMSADILQSNAAMCKLAEKSGFTLITSEEDKDLYRAKRSLIPPPAAEKRKSKQ
ncbi:bifunctional acetate--CoA ligase family protein/GNAT family N-acetyltransferase [Neisseria perflava]|uniref:bifunctional acetate--CoA ligase family protein/GNAT family N-acetyltransferase n=1 Tax=Neisseria perflava TaxID=33053 RepID=UPI0020A11E49|nr:bifunctional acetate--CoA ligase family protein/GNAT family N-acetyltransferase [Neisseria perflava]MCP1659972.1 acyl-CoA synthetase (NDP forming)/RimJ/RimL family protein N-acetyltransferase [Neisseria perflava]MCP1773347.1 acyl-CoA synthetase (NDP forming)/RimJ/RimL family protein N-acetyltransferase [Neisseria perflava]